MWFKFALFLEILLEKCLLINDRHNFVNGFPGNAYIYCTSITKTENTKVYLFMRLFTHVLRRQIRSSRGCKWQHFALNWLAPNLWAVIAIANHCQLTIPNTNTRCEWPVYGALIPNNSKINYLIKPNARHPLATA